MVLLDCPIISELEPCDQVITAKDSWKSDHSDNYTDLVAF